MPKAVFFLHAFMYNIISPILEISDC